MTVRLPYAGLCAALLVHTAGAQMPAAPYYPERGGWQADARNRQPRIRIRELVLERRRQADAGGA
jgi:hypothetical protein